MSLDIENSQKCLKNEDQCCMSKLVEGIIIAQKITEEIVKTDNYVNWLGSFILKYKDFSDNYWLYCPEKITVDDQDKVSKLGNFYDAIQTYANRNYIYGTPNDFGQQYYIKHNNIGYEIGVMMGQGTIFFAKRHKLTKKNSDDFIDFELIQEDKTTDRAEIIRQKLENLDSLINNIASENVPVEAIVETTEKRLRLLMKKEKNNC